MKVLSFVNNCFQCKCPSIYNDYFKKRESVYNLRIDTLQVPRTRTELGSSAMRVTGARAWNELNKNI